MIRQIVFDLDGVLFDGCNLHAEIFIQAVNMIVPEWNLTRKYHDEVLCGLSTKKKLENMGITGSKAEEVYALKQKLTGEEISNHIHPDLKVQEICRVLTEGGYKIYCVSNSIRSTVEVCLRGMGVIQYFSGIISNEDTAAPKPSPEPYLTLFRGHRLQAEECLIVEDSPFGIESATKSGGKVLAVKDCSEVTLEKIWEYTVKYRS